MVSASVHILQKPRIVYHFKLVHVALVCTCVCSHSLIDWTSLLHYLLLKKEKKRKKKKRKNGWTENSGQCVKNIYTVRGLSRVFSRFWISLFSVWGTSFAFLHFSRTLSFFHSPPCVILTRERTPCRKRKRFNYAWPRKERVRKVSDFCEKVLHFVNLSQLVHSFLHSGYGFLVCFCVCVCVCVCVSLFYVSRANVHTPPCHLYQSFAITFLYTLCPTRGILSNWSFDPDGTSLVQG